MLHALAGLLLLLAPAAAERDGPGSTAGPSPAPEGLSSLRARAAAEAARGPEGVARLVAAASSAGPRERRAALDALGDLPEGAAPDAAVAPALRSLGSTDPEERAAALRALLACGSAARAALEARAAPPREGVAAVPEADRRRAAEALASFGRREVEREFLSIWSPEDGQFRGMYASLRRHGPLGARVLAAIALDRRMAGADLLGHGPYSWLHAPDPSRERTEVRDRALTALEDAGDPSVIGYLRSILRPAPAAQLFDDFDNDPVPAGLDDAVRRVLACLGEPRWLEETLRASESGGSFRGLWSTTVELRRQASAHGTLGECLPDPKERARHEDQCVRLLNASIAQKERVGLSVDGVEYYNLACALARRDRPGDRDAALSHLARSVKTYAVSADWFARDGDLASLHGDPRFDALVALLRARERALDEKR